MNDMMLVVDDMAMNRAIIRVLFEDKYEVMEAESGEEALEILERCQGSIDIVLLDLIMPGMSGFDLLKQRKTAEFFKNVPVIVITGSSAMDDQIKAFELGANDYIAKPFIPEIVVTRVENVMASNRRMLSIEMEARRMKIKSELDEMTGLYNKTTSEDTMDSLLKFSENHLQVMMIIDIDNFKTVNDTSGHQAGDHVIKIIANLISGLFRKTDVVGRIGGDEFCVLMVDVPDMEIARTKVNELIQLMRYKPNLTIPEYVTLSIGLATNERQNTNYVNLFKKADQALYLAKKGGKAQCREYGVEPVKVGDDVRPAVLLLSSGRGVCSMVHALMPSQVRVLEVLRMEYMKLLSQEDIDKTVMVFADISDYKDGGVEFWHNLSEYSWIDNSTVIAVCEESNTAQYMCALQNGICDILTSPMDADTFKRITVRQLKRLQILDVDNKE